MAATVNHTMSVTYRIRYVKMLSAADTRLGNHTYCLRTLYRCLCSSTDNTSTINNIITKQSTVDESVAKVLEQEHVGKSGQIQYRKHPGVMIEKNSHLPVRLTKAMQILFEKYPVKTLETNVEKLVHYLWHRQPPVTERELAEKTKEVESKILKKDGHKLEGVSEEEREIVLENIRKKVINRLRQNIYNWKPMQYDAFTSYIYLMGRTASDYSILLQSFTEISKRDADFKPTSILHHGSKVGSGIWAADKMWKQIGEHYCVEESSHMNTVAQLLLQDGNEQQTVSSIRGVHFRHFIPSAKEHKFSMVVSSGMLMEQASQNDRLLLVKDLWEMAEIYLVLVETGTGAGFSLINEAKEFILLNSQEPKEHFSPGHVFAPCPHDKSCPKLRDKIQPCLTESTLYDIDFTTKKLKEKSRKHARYSYVILKKGPRETDTEWPRVLHPIKAQRHVHVHACLPCGNLQHVVITKGKFEKHLYGCSKYLEQGDRLPVSLSSQPMTTSLDDVEASVSEDSSSDTEECDHNNSLDNTDINFEKN